MTIRKMGLVTTGLMLGAALTAAPGRAANLDVASVVDAVTVYPDGATVTRVISLDLPAGETTAIAKDFPLGLDASSLRVEGEAGAKLVIGTVDPQPPPAAPPLHPPEIDQRIEALPGPRTDLHGAIAAGPAR